MRQKVEGGDVSENYFLLATNIGKYFFFFLFFLNLSYCLLIFFHIGTTITSGSAVGVVFSTGAETEIGKISSMLSEDDKKTPLQVISLFHFPFFFFSSIDRDGVDDLF